MVPSTKFSTLCQCLYFEGIWNNYGDIAQNNMEVRIIMCTQGYNSLGDPTKHLKQTKKTSSNTNWSMPPIAECLFITVGATCTIYP